jgi:hypothetical protein
MVQLPVALSVNHQSQIRRTTVFALEVAKLIDQLEVVLRFHQASGVVGSVGRSSIRDCAKAFEATVDIRFQHAYRLPNTCHCRIAALP